MPPPHLPGATVNPMALTLRARVRGGRLVLDEPVALPEGSEVDLVLAEELRAAQRELDARQECEIDLEACVDDHERQLLQTMKQRIDAATRGDTRTVSMADAAKVLRGQRRSRRRSASR